MSNENLEAGYYKLFLLFLEENGAKIEVTPYAAAALLLKVTVTIFKLECLTQCSVSQPFSLCLTILVDKNDYGSKNFNLTLLPKWILSKTIKMINKYVVD
jgi:hypothetical protein